MRLFALFAAVAVLLLTCLPRVSGQQPTHVLRVAAASDLSPVLPRLATEYEHGTGVHIIASFASSATLTEQIRSGAPFDVFLSADTLHPLQLVQGGHSLSSAPVPYARGELVLWARKDSPAQPLSLASLTSQAVAKISIANPAHAPYGLAAQQFLQHEHLWDQLQPKLVTAENITQAAQFAESGNAQLGLISLTAAHTEHFSSIGSFVVVPPGSYAPLQQAGLVLKTSRDPAAATSFLQWLTSPAVQTRLPQFGLAPAR